MQAIQARIQAVEAHAAEIARNEAKKIVADNEGALQSVVDAGGRDAMKSSVVDLQSSVKNFGEKAEKVIGTIHCWRGKVQGSDAASLSRSDDPAFGFL